ncbi:MAG: secretin N-terminal domain-containing protein [Sulfuricella sp.]|nr:secretin N-terminal domain-containing protein [Sulfuricella sp.]
MNKALIAIAGCLLLAACGTQPATPSTGHLKDEPRPAGNIPQPVQQTASLAPPKAAPKVETYSVVVNNVAVQELLFALARDARLNIDLHPGIEGSVTLNALNQTLPQLLNRIAKQVDMRYELDGSNLTVMPDTPFLRNYKIDYVNISRDASSNVNIATQIATTGSGGIGSGGVGGSGAAGAGNNNSTTQVTNTSNNHFWGTLVQNIKDILRETDKILPDGSSETTTEQSGNQTTTGTGVLPTIGKNSKAATSIASSPNPTSLTNAGMTTVRRTTFREAASVIVNAEAGLIAVRATSRQHEKIQEFLDQVLVSAKRQVLIEATIVEVQLNDEYQSGIDWKRVAFGAGFTLRQNLVGTDLANVVNTLPDPNRQALISAILGDTNLTPTIQNNLIDQISPGFAAAGGKIPLADTAFASASKGMTIGYSNSGSIAGAVQLLSTFGNVKVLSSPKISALNNQTALLKVVDNRIYFTISVTPGSVSSGVITPPTYTSTLNTLPVGFVMSVTPQIDENDTITLNVRPTISRILRYVTDPNPILTGAVKNLIPEIQVREMESILKINSGQTAMMGGLMEDVVNKSTDGIPGLSQVPVLGNIFSNRDDKTTKTELVIFLRPAVVKDASLDGDYKAYRSFLPNENTLKDPRDAAPNPLPESAKVGATAP